MKKYMLFALVLTAVVFSISDAEAQRITSIVPDEGQPTESIRIEGARLKSCGGSGAEWHVQFTAHPPQEAGLNEFSFFFKNEMPLSDEIAIVSVPGARELMEELDEIREPYVLNNTVPGEIRMVSVEGGTVRNCSNSLPFTFVKPLVIAGVTPPSLKQGACFVIRGVGFGNSGAIWYRLITGASVTEMVPGTLAATRYSNTYVQACLPATFTVGEYFINVLRAEDGKMGLADWPLIVERKTEEPLMIKPLPRVPPTRTPLRIP